MAASIITRGSSSLESLKGRSRPKIQIDLVNQTEGLVSSYTTKGQIEGTVTIRVDHDTRFEDVEITFEGATDSPVSWPGFACMLTAENRNSKNISRARGLPRPHRGVSDIPQAAPAH